MHLDQSAVWEESIPLRDLHEIACEVTEGLAMGSVILDCILIVFVISSVGVLLAAGLILFDYSRRPERTPMTSAELREALRQEEEIIRMRTSTRRKT